MHLYMPYTHSAHVRRRLPTVSPYKLSSGRHVHLRLLDGELCLRKSHTCIAIPTNTAQHYAKSCYTGVL